MDHIEELQQRLYTRNPDNLPQPKYGILHPIKQKAESTWGQSPVKKGSIVRHRTAAGYRRFFICTLLFFLAGLGVALFSYYRGAITVSSKNVDLSILGNAFVSGGDELPIQVEVANKNATDLVNAQLVLNYPKGATDQTGTDVVQLEQPLGTIASGKTKSQDFVAVLYGEQGTSRTITAKLTYQLAGSSATFEKDATFSVMISSSPVGLTVDAPTAVVSNQPFTITLHNSFSGDKLLNNVITRVDYPDGFVFQSATPAPSSGNNVWSLGDLQTGDERDITITGRLVGEVNDEKAFRIYIGTPESDTDTSIAVAYNSALATMHIVQPFISGALSVNGNSDDVIPLTVGDAVNGTIAWTNTSAYTVTNPTFTLTLAGNSIDTSSVTAPNAYYDATANTITWNADSDSAIASIAPGATGTLPFSFNTLTEVTGSRDVTLGLSVSGTFPDQGNAVQSIDTIDQKTVRFGSTIQFAAQSLYSIGAITNTGPYPPKANKATTYTIMWSILPSENAITDATASAILPSGVDWTGKTMPSTEDVTYNTATRTVTWNIGPLPATSGTPASRSASFQVQVKPTTSEIGNPLDLLGQTTVTATDSVTQTPITTTRAALTTKLDTDPAYTTGKDLVVP